MEKEQFIDAVYAKQSSARKVVRVSRDVVEAVYNFMTTPKQKRLPVRTFAAKHRITLRKLSSIINDYKKLGLEYDTYASGFKGVWKKVSENEQENV